MCRRIGRRGRKKKTHTHTSIIISFRQLSLPLRVVRAYPTRVSLLTHCVYEARRRVCCWISRIGERHNILCGLRGRVGSGGAWTWRPRNYVYRPADVIYNYNIIIYIVNVRFLTTFFFYRFRNLVFYTLSYYTQYGKLRHFSVAFNRSR